MKRFAGLIFAALVVVATTFFSSAVEGAQSTDRENDTSVGSEQNVNRFLNKLSPDEPLFFSMGWREEWNASFQLSFKYAFMNTDDPVLLRGPLWTRVFFGYTQRSLWILGEESSPFYDTSYRPSLFYRQPLALSSSSGQLSFGWQAGVEHESNGQGGDESRSLNIAYFEPRFDFASVFGGRLVVRPRVWTYVGNLDDNPDIAEYRGYGQLLLAYTSEHEWQLAATFRLGTEGHESVQLDLTYPMDKLLLPTFDAYLHLQYFSGWGETLRSYDQRRPWQLRVGLAVVRW